MEQNNPLATYIYVTIILAIVGFLIGVYIIRAIFDIPTIVRYHKAQVRLLEAMAKKQGVDNKTVTNIVSESYGWTVSPQKAAAPTKAEE